MMLSNPPARESTAEARALVAAGALLLDVRSREEYAAGHVKGAKNLPVQELAQRLSEVGPTRRPVVVYCASGGRSATAAQLLRAAGYRVHDVGPMPRW